MTSLSSMGMFGVLYKMYISIFFLRRNKNDSNKMWYFDAFTLEIQEKMYLFCSCPSGQTMLLCAIYITELFIMKLQTYFMFFRFFFSMLLDCLYFLFLLIVIKLFITKKTLGTLYHQYFWSCLFLINQSKYFTFTILKQITFHLF